MTERFESGKTYMTTVGRNTFDCIKTNRFEATLRSPNGVLFNVSQGVRNYYEEVVQAVKKIKPKCPGCKQADADYRQEKRPHLCAWCGYDHDTGQVAGLVPASKSSE